MNTRILLPALALTALGATSCVSTKKYQAALDREQQLVAQNGQLNTSITALNGRIDSFENENVRLTRQIDDANCRIGFLAIVNHGISTQLLDDMYDVTAEFFDSAESRDTYDRAQTSRTDADGRVLRLDQRGAKPAQKSPLQRAAEAWRRPSSSAG